MAVSQADDCGYFVAVPALLNAGSSMEQKTPSATTHSSKWRRRSRDAPKSADAVLQSNPKKRSRSESEGVDSEENDSPPSSGCCGMMRPRKRARLAIRVAAPPSCVFSPPPKIVENPEVKWTTLLAEEQASPFRVLPNYPDFSRMLPPGARRRAVNIIHLMSRTLNLEICTPCLGVLIMDRFLSTRQDLPSCRESVMLTAMICLNTAGKVADVDKGFCGSRGVMAMVRDATPIGLRQKDHDSFARYAAEIEREVLKSIDSTLLSCPCAMQIISEVTNWNNIDEPLWLRSAILCDVFSTDSISTRYTQCDIARAVFGVLTGAREAHAATYHMVQSINMFVNSARESVLWKDPYFGARCRHADNSELGYFFEHANRLLVIYCTATIQNLPKM